MLLQNSSKLIKWSEQLSYLGGNAKLKPFTKSVFSALVRDNLEKLKITFSGSCISHGFMNIVMLVKI